MSTLMMDRTTCVAAVSRREFLTLIGAAGMLTACSSSLDDESGPSTRTVVHPLGATEVPISPRRVIALDRRAALPHLLALGVTPVGALTYESIIGTPFPPIVTEQSKDVAVLPTAGGADDPSLESVVALEPDLVIGWTGGIADQYDALSRLAPTVAVDVDFTDAAVSLRAIAAAVGREARADEVVTAFADRRAGRLGEIGEIGDVSVVLSIGDGQFRIYRPAGSSVARWLVDAGGRIADDPDALVGEAYEDMFVTVSPENLGQVSGSTIVVMYNTGDAGEAALAELENSPLWISLPAVAAGRVVRINSQESVGSYGFQGYESVLDELVDQWLSLPDA